MIITPFIKLFLISAGGVFLCGCCEGVCHVCFHLTHRRRTWMSASTRVCRSEVKAMTTKQKVCRVMTKELVTCKQTSYFLRKRHASFSTKTCGRVGNKLIDFFPTRRATWERLQNAESLDVYYSVCVDWVVRLAAEIYHRGRWTVRELFPIVIQLRGKRCCAFSVQ